MAQLTDDIAALETDIKRCIDKIRLVRSRAMRETEDGTHKSAVALLELSARALAQADDAARYARHNLGRQESA